MRNKKHNPKKHSINYVKKMLETHCIGFMSGDDHCFLWNIETGKITQQIDPALAKSITEHQYKWEMVLMALCVDDGRPYIKADHRCTNVETTHDSLLDTLNMIHKWLVDGCNKKHLARPAWMIYAGRNSIPDLDRDMKRYIELFESRGGFDRVEVSV